MKRMDPLQFSHMVLTPKGLLIMVPKGLVVRADHKKAPKKKAYTPTLPKAKAKAAKPNGSKRPYVRLGPEVKAEIKKIYKQGEAGYRDLAQRYGVSVGTVRNIVVG